ncbi:hypothetical protein [Corallococcus sp. CA047B]|uniref:hypothetical protein n=1 Tax=Corallococcus sp. CA047B TaxID=2316729 RepID=UPI0011C461B8|nr:hypothetical protein [Corallococcus sp. CA047B]
MSHQPTDQSLYTITYEPFARLHYLSLDAQVREPFERYVTERARRMGETHEREVASSPFVDSAIERATVEGYRVFLNRHFDERTLHVSKIEAQGCRCILDKRGIDNPCKVNIVPQNVLEAIFRSLSTVVLYLGRNGASLPVSKTVWNRLSEFFSHRSNQGHLLIPSELFGGAELLQVDESKDWHIDVCSFIALYQSGGWADAVSDVRAGLNR